MSHSLNSLKGGYIGIIYGTIMEVIKGDTRSLDNGSYRAQSHPTFRGSGQKPSFVMELSCVLYASHRCT